MRNEAKYICCLGGFIGFISFFTITLLFGDDVLAAVVRGSIGCLFCSLCARGILHLVLRSLASAKNGIGMKTIAAPTTKDSEEETTPIGEIVQESTESAATLAPSEPSPATVEPAAA